jgi:hypothetical protein
MPYIYPRSQIALSLLQKGAIYDCAGYTGMVIGLMDGLMGLRRIYSAVNRTEILLFIMLLQSRLQYKRQLLMLNVMNRFEPEIKIGAT